jgi:NAD(P)-dependent dehydrogenase (short-subunit alcohol dehydrogenase family)
MMGRAANTLDYPDQQGFCRHFGRNYYVVLNGKSILKSLKIMDLKLEAKTALVSGSTAGIGLAIATSLAAEGARVIVNGRTEARVQQALAAIRGTMSSPPKLEPLVADLSLTAGASLCFQRFPEVDILVNNLGVYAPKPFEQISDADWLAVIETNFMSGVRLCRCYLPRMKQNNWGRIIFISSESGVNIPVEMIHYGVTKTMQIALARGLAETTAGTGVTVNSVLAGPTRSEGVEQFLKDMAARRGITPAAVEKEFFQNVRPSSLLQRFASSEEVAALVTYVASPVSCATNGAALRAEGGVVRSIL